MSIAANPMPLSVTSAYIDGIRDERALLRSMRERGEPADPAALLANIAATLKGFPSGPVADHLRGARDFWRLQTAKGTR